MQGPGLALAAFSQVVSLFPGSSFWAILFFMALLIIGLSNLMRLLESIVFPLQNSISVFRNYPRILTGTVDSHPSDSLAFGPSSSSHPQSPGLTLTPEPSPTHRPQVWPNLPLP